VIEFGQVIRQYVRTKLKYVEKSWSENTVLDTSIAVGNILMLRETLLFSYFPKMKVGLSYHQSVCLCFPLITFEPLGKSS
jgi:hypothetical protein